MGMSIAQALDYPGELVAIWDWGASEEKLLVCSIADGKLTVMASRDMSKADRARWSDELRTKGVRQGATSGVAPFYWSNDGAFTVWSLTDTVVTSSGDVLETAAGTRVLRGDAARVWTFLDNDSLGHRGVRVVTASGAALTIAEEDDPAAQLDPTYGMDNVQIDGAWATFMGRDLAAWLGVPHVDDMV